MMTHLRPVAVLLCTCLALPAGAGSVPPPKSGTAGYQKLHAVRVEAPPVKDSNATQFLAADSKGHPFLLRGDTLEVFRQGADGAFDRLMGRLACSRSPEWTSAYAAAMDPTDLTWAVSSSDEVALCDFAREKRPPAMGWGISSLTYSRSGPLVMVTALGPPPDATNYFKRTVPRVFGLKDGRWQPVVSMPVAESNRQVPTDRLAAQAELAAHGMEILAEGKAESDALLCTTAKDEIWLASWNSYRLQRVSASEKAQGPEREIVVGSGGVEWSKLSKTEQERAARESQVQGSGLVLSTVGGAAPRGVVRALACDREIYLVVAAAEGLALDRYDPAQNVLERVLLADVEASSGPMTAALAGDQLWLAGRFAADGLWRIPLQDLATAHWKPVKGVKADGVLVQ
jgi:hypothetical protein